MTDPSDLPALDVDAFLLLDEPATKGWSGVPEGTIELALVVEDPDAPSRRTR